MDREARVRAARRRQALDALAFERHRETMLEGQLDDTVAEIDGKRVDSDVYRLLSTEDARLVRAALGEDLSVPGDSDVAAPVELDRVAGEAHAEVARLQGELAASRRVQAALVRYLDVL